MVVRHRLEIEAPIGRVFALVDDPQKIKLWMHGLEETVYRTPRSKANPVGTRFTQRIRRGRQVAEYDGEVTAYDKPRHLAVRMGNEKFAFDVDYRLAISETVHSSTTPPPGRTPRVSPGRPRPSSRSWRAASPPSRCAG